MNIFNESLTSDELIFVQKIAPDLKTQGPNMYPDSIVDTLWAVFKKVRNHASKPAALEKAKFDFAKQVEKLASHCR